MRQPVTNYEAASRSGVIRQKREVCRLLRHKPAVNRRAEDGWVDGQRGGGMEGWRDGGQGPGIRPLLPN